jgi:hypothetical protein
MADAMDSKSIDRKIVEVQVLSPVFFPFKSSDKSTSDFFQDSFNPLSAMAGGRVDQLGWIPTLPTSDPANFHPETDRFPDSPPGLIP